jgi:Transcriptional regulator
LTKQYVTNNYFITFITTHSARKRLTRDETRERIMIKADELFRQFGFGKTTVADIAAELGMSPANIYKFFSSKEAIIQASADRNLVALSRSRAPAHGCIRCGIGSNRKGAPDRLPAHVRIFCATNDRFLN